jgi:hypothetical protein
MTLFQIPDLTFLVPRIYYMNTAPVTLRNCWRKLARDMLRRNFVLSRSYTVSYILWLAAICPASEWTIPFNPQFSFTRHSCAWFDPKGVNGRTGVTSFQWPQLSCGGS